jgi:CTP-dependent riboflavin kinase
MNVRVVNKVWKESQVSGRPLIVLLALASRANERGEVDITANDLQHQCRLNAQQFSGCLEQLESTRQIQVKGPNAAQERLH